MVSSIQSMGSMRPMGGMQRPDPLTDEQKTKVKDLLSQFGSENLTTEDAKSLFKSFQEAGIRGPGLREVIKEAGFDAEQVWSLAHDGQNPPQPGGSGNMNKINASALQTLQLILEQYDLTSLSGDQETDLISQLSSAGLMKTGSLLDLTA